MTDGSQELPPLKVASCQAHTMDGQQMDTNADHEVSRVLAELETMVERTHYYLRTGQLGSALGHIGKVIDLIRHWSETDISGNAHNADTNNKLISKLASRQKMVYASDIGLRFKYAVDALREGYPDKEKKQLARLRECASDYDLLVYTAICSLRSGFYWDTEMLIKLALTGNTENLVLEDFDHCYRHLMNTE